MKKLFLFILSFQSCFLAAQSSRCGFIAPNNYAPALYSLASDIDGVKQPLKKLDKAISQEFTTFEIQLFVFDNQSGYINKIRIDNSLKRLNKIFSGANISFRQSGPARFINDPQFISFDRTMEKRAFEKYSKDNVINIYCVNEIVPDPGSDGEEYAGYTYHPDNTDLAYYQKNFIVLSYDGLVEKSTLSHEMGHFFGLLHTHENCNNPALKEPVSRVDCKKKGDFICDTAADPDLTGVVDATNIGNCSYTGTKTDDNGIPYQPMVENIMSYASPGCRTKLTRGQYYVIQRVAKFKRSYLKQNQNFVKKGKPFVQFFEDLGAAQANADFTPTDMAVILVYKDSTQWSERMFSELAYESELAHFFIQNGPYSLVVYDAEMHRASIPDFLDNDSIKPSGEGYSEYEYIRTKLLPYVVRYPSVFVLDLSDPLSRKPKILAHNEGYLKPRQLLVMLNDFKNTWTPANALTTK